ncbi:hypothetical protein ACQKLP_20905 [Chitinophaga sp. NPDC101104]|uniref:hypothetical protein n=1 Tax=Chitinophaga sp. NPDC101104 TaxID=3390561 RepID=UPI003D05050C
MDQPLGIGRILLLLLPFTASAQQSMAGGRQQLAPVPAAVSGVKQVSTSLAGTWEIRLSGQKASRRNGPGRIRVLSDGSQAARMDVEADGKQWLVISDKWDYWSLAWGNFQGVPNPSKQMKGIIRFIIE